MKKLNLNKESLQRLDEKQMSELRGGGFLSLWGSSCYATNPGKHACCAPDTNGEPCNPWSADPQCDMPLAWGEARELADGTIQYLDDDGNAILNPEFNAGNCPYILVQ